MYLAVVVRTKSFGVDVTDFVEKLTGKGDATEGGKEDDEVLFLLG